MQILSPLIGPIIGIGFAAALLSGCQTAPTAGQSSSNPPGNPPGNPAGNPPGSHRSTDGSVRVVNHAPGLKPAMLARLADQTEREYQKLQRLFGVHVGRVTVNVRAQGVGRHFPPSAIRIPRDTVLKGSAITAHELTHLLNQGWASKVLKEGLAVYGQNRVGEQRGWPNYKLGIHRAAYRAITDPANDPISPVQTPAEAERAFATAKLGQTVKRKAAYNISGSWVTWLIEQSMGGDLDRFMRTLYRRGDYRAATGKSYGVLEAAWGRFIVRRATGKRTSQN